MFARQGNKQMVSPWSTLRRNTSVSASEPHSSLQEGQQLKTSGQADMPRLGLLHAGGLMALGKPCCLPELSLPYL